MVVRDVERWEWEFLEFAERRNDLYRKVRISFGHAPPKSAGANGCCVTGIP